MNWKDCLQQSGVPAAIGAALLFGMGTPMVKLLLVNVSPWLLAGLLYLGSGIGLTFYRWITHAPAVRLSVREMLWLAGAIASGGVIGPVLLMLGLTGMPASGTSLLLNAEGVFTALLAWFAFKENFDRRIALGMVAIVLGAIVLSWPEAARFAGWWPALAVLGACLAWGIDNNLTRKVSLVDATQIASAKGLTAGCVNMALAFFLGAPLPEWPNLMGALFVGFLAYGVSLRHLGTAAPPAPGVLFNRSFFRRGAFRGNNEGPRNRAVSCSRGTDGLGDLVTPGRVLKVCRPVQLVPCTLSHNTPIVEGANGLHGWVGSIA